MIRPLTGHCLIRILPPDEKTSSGLWLADVAQERGEKARPRKGFVIACGPWKTTKQGYAILPDFRPGDTVLLSEYIGTKLTRAIGENLRLCRVDDVLAVVEENGDSSPH
jgi:chaperonin GroES